MGGTNKEIEGIEPKNRWYLLEVDKPLVIPIHTISSSSMPSAVTRVSLDRFFQK